MPRATLSLVAAGLLASSFTAATAAAAPVETVRSYWSDDGTAIYSDVVVENADGSRASRRVLGGSVDGIAMIQIALLGDGPLQIDYVPTVNKGGAKLHWAGSCVFLTPDLGGTKAMTLATEVAAITAAASTWNEQPASCSYLRFTVKAAEKAEVGYDGKNVVKFREDVWAHGGNTTDPANLFNHSATAITTLMFIDDPTRLDNGTILDTDIEMNGLDYAMATGCETRCVTSATHGVVEDLQNTMTHELGHVIGLGHTCFSPDPANPKATAPLDNTGKVSPRCDLGAALPKSVTDATMYNFQSPMETAKRTLSQDDIDGACGTYPTAKDPRVCEPVQIAGKSGCGVAPGGRDARGLILGGLAVALAVWRRRRRSSRPR